MPSSEIVYDDADVTITKVTSDADPDEPGGWVCMQTEEKNPITEAPVTVDPATIDALTAQAAAATSVAGLRTVVTKLLAALNPS